LVKALADEVPILYNTVATGVHYGSRGVTVTTAAGSAVTADACIVTVPLGILKHNAITFNPPLPESKRKAVQSLGYACICTLHEVWGMHAYALFTKSGVCMHMHFSRSLLGEQMCR
jgi:monoamine oxidase